MKKNRLFLTFIILINALSIRAQDSNILVSFLNNDWKQYDIIRIDSNNPKNIWQIGTLSKKIFNKNIFGNIALITDTLKSYPINNKSVFYLTPSFPHTKRYGLYFGIDYKFDSDSLKDYGMMELSIDSGKTWVDLLKDTIYTYNWFANIYFQPALPIDRPILTGRINNWLSSQFSLKPDYCNDSIILKFTFISDSIDTKQEGWLIGAFYFTRFMDDIIIIDHSEDALLNIYPNPINNYGIIDISNYKETIKQINIIDLYGENHKVVESPKENIIINKQDFNPGMYIVYFILKDNSVLTKKIIIL